jgi:hypothetical protein
MKRRFGNPKAPSTMSFASPFATRATRATRAETSCMLLKHLLIGTSRVPPITLAWSMLAPSTHNYEVVADFNTLIRGM